MNIKEAASRLGISARAIRFYEEKGLIQPAKQVSNGYRTYTENDIWRLQTIAKATRNWHVFAGYYSRARRDRSR